MQNLTGLTYGPFRIERLLGFGATAAVYQASRVSSGELVTLKVLAPELSRESSVRDAFLREANAVLELHHRNLITPFHIAELYGRPYIVFPFIEGCSLSGMMKAQKFMEPSALMQILTELAQSIDYLHANHILHRDVKPGNILIATDGIMKLIDFGLSLHESEVRRLPKEAWAEGTSPYLAPELLDRRSPPSVASDIYAFAVTSWECICPISEVGPLSRAFQGVLLPALNEDPKKRPTSASEIAVALRRLNLDVDR